MRIDALQAPDVLPMIARFLTAQLAYRGHDFEWFSEAVPKTRPAGRFGVVAQLNTRLDDDLPSFVSVLTQQRIYDANPERAKTTAELVNALMQMMPVELEAQSTEHAGGPVLSPDPDVPLLRRYLGTYWVTVPSAVI